MQSARLFRRNNQKLQSLLPRQFFHKRYFSSSRLRYKKESEDDCSHDEQGSTSSDDSIKVTVIGAAGRVGRTLSLLLKTSPLVDQLCMFDIDRSVKGICVDIGHIDTKCSVNYVCGMRNIQEALDDPDVVLIAAGSPSTPQINGKKLFRKNAPVVAGLTEACARFCPEACIVLITNPINSLLPVAGEVYELVTGEKPSEKLFGLTTLDVVRANTFIAEAIRRDPCKVIVPVIGGTSEDTIVPVISQMKPCARIKHEEVVALTECVKQAEGSLTDCQNCGTRGSSSLSTAYAAFRFTSSLISALKGAKNIVECAYVQSDILPELQYMASPLRLGTCGIEFNYGYPKLSEYEVSLMERAAPVLQKDIKLGKAYVIEQRGKHYQKRSKTLTKGGKSDSSVDADDLRKSADPMNFDDLVEEGGQLQTTYSCAMDPLLTSGVSAVEDPKDGDSEYEVKLMENGALALRADIEMGKLYVSENKSTILKSLKDGFFSESAGEESNKNSCKIHEIVEVSEPVEAVSLNSCKPQAKSPSSPIVKSQGEDTATGYSAVLHTLVERAIGSGCSAASDCLPCPVQTQTGAAVREIDKSFYFVRLASLATYPAIMYVMYFLVLYLSLFFRF